MAVKKTSREPNLPFYFKRLDVFLRDVRVGVAQQKELEMAREALKQVYLILYDVDDPFNCPGPRQFFPPILMNK